MSDALMPELGTECDFGDSTQYRVITDIPITQKQNVLIELCYEDGNLQQAFEIFEHINLSDVLYYLFKFIFIVSEFFTLVSVLWAQVT